MEGLNVYKRIVMVIFLGCLLIGCGKKAQLGKASTGAPEVLNQAASTETELALMQDNTKSSAKTEQGPAADSTTSTEQTQASQTTPVTSGIALPQQQQVSKTPTIQEIQQALKNANLYQGEIDGNLGPKTKKAIKDFQEQNSLKADGKVGLKTWAKLQPFLTKAPEGEQSNAKD